MPQGGDRLSYLGLLDDVCGWVVWKDYLQMLRNDVICVDSHESCEV